MSKKDKVSKTEILAGHTEGFLRTHSRLFAIIAAVVIVAVIAIGIIYFASSSSTEERYETLYTLESEYNSLLLIDETSDEYSSAVSSLKSSLDSFISDNKITSYEGAKANMILADILFLEENWEEAYAIYLAVAEANEDNYLGQLNYMNAAAAVENAGDTAEALRLYNLVFDTYGINAPMAPKALFNQARIEESQGNLDLATTIYNQLIDQYQSSYYSALAESKLLVLSAN